MPGKPGGERRVVSRGNMRQPLTTARLVCEPLATKHARLLFGELRNARLYRFIPQDPPASLDALETRYTRLASHPHSPDGSELWLNWAMRERSRCAYVGTLEASVTPGHQAEIAYMVFEPSQRLGYAGEGVDVMINYLFERHAIDVVIAEIDTRNAASIALVLSLGFDRVAKTTGADYFKGSPSDEYRFELRRDAARRDHNSA